MTTFDPTNTSAFSLTTAIEPYQSGPLSGLTFAVKDLIDTAGFVTNCGNPSWHQDHSPAVINAVCVDQLLGAGARCIGKTKTNEFAFGLTGENDFYGTALNPKVPERIPGGSSAGSASAVASGACDFALGTDTGGSVRVPASNCGVWGMRPSHGRISVAGVNPLASSFDSVGVFAQRGDVLSKSMHCLFGSEETTQANNIREILIPVDIIEQCSPAVIECCQRWKQSLSQHASTHDIRLNEICNIDSNLRELFKHYCAIHWCEIWSDLGDWVEDKQPELGSATAINFELAKNANRKHLFEALQYKQLINTSINALLNDYRCLLLPTTPDVPPIKGQVSLDRTKGIYLPQLSGLSSLAAFARCPQITIPVASINNIPQGLSLMAATNRDEWLLKQCQHDWISQYSLDVVL